MNPLTIDRNFDQVFSYPHLHKDLFSTEFNVKQGKPTDQKKTFRCWIFAALNMLRARVLEEFGEDFAFSYNYVAFWDKFERARFYLDLMEKLSVYEPMSREVENAQLNLLVEGGEWENFVNVVKKYGLVPSYAMPETACSEDSGDYLKQILYRLREIGGLIHRKAREGVSNTELAEIKAIGLEEVKNALIAFLGKPPEQFVWKEKEGSLSHILPMDFFQKLGKDLDDYVHVANLPHLDMGIKVEVEGVSIQAINLPMDEVKNAIRASIQDNQSVVCTTETRNLDKGCNFYSVKANPRERILAVSAKMALGKADRLRYRVSQLRHLMTIIGCDGEKPKRQFSKLPDELSELAAPFWKLENSRKDVEELYTSDAWLDEFLFAVVIDKKYLPEKYLELNQSEAKKIPSWDPLGRI